jgi:sterol desaturase/sphingolipid hydroxylase (fatty acid hydroxylase superfamily)
MHGIHHSIVKQETNSNYAVIFTFWDKLHKTTCLHVPQENIIIGVPSYMDPAEHTPIHLLALPFLPLRAWRLANGETPERTTPTGKKKELAE